MSKRLAHEIHEPRQDKKIAVSLLTKLAIAAAMAAGYYVVEYKPAQERKKKAKKKAVIPPTPATPPTEESRVIFVDNIEDGVALEKLDGQKIFVFVTMAKGSVYAAVAPVFGELSVTYPDVNFVEFDMAAVLKEYGGEDVQSNVALTGGGIQGQPEIGRCVNFFEGPTSFEDQLAEFGESMTSEGPECSVADIRTADVVQELVSIAEYINGLSSRATRRPATRGGGALAGFHARKGRGAI